MRALKGLLTIATLVSLVGVASATDTNWTAVWAPLVAMIEGLQPLFPALLVLFVAAMPLIIGMAVLALVTSIIALIVMRMKSAL